MKVLVIGGTGMLGNDLVVELRRREHEVFAPSHQDLDITDPMSVASLALNPGMYDWCTNCAAYTAVDKAESESQAAMELNVLGPGYLSNACSMAGIKLIHLSTDFVFDGEASTPYDEEAVTHPLGVYGETKRDGESAVLAGNTNSLVVRTSWLFGVHGKCFPKTMIDAWSAGKSLSVVCDQVGCPTFTVDLSRVLVDLVERNAYPGIYHCCGPTITNWHAFAVEAISAWSRLTGDTRPIELKAIPTEQYPTPAKRPKFSVMSCEKLMVLGIAPPRQLRGAIEDFVTVLARNRGYTE